MLLSQHSEFVGCTTFFDLSCAGYLGVITISHGSFVPTTSTRDRWVQLTLHAACQMLDCIPIFGDGHQSIYIPILMIRIMRWMTISHTAFFWPWNVWSHLRSLLLHCWSATNQVDTGRNPSMVIAGSHVDQVDGYTRYPIREIFPTGELLRNHQVQVEMHERLGYLGQADGFGYGDGPMWPICTSCWWWMKH